MGSRGIKTAERRELPSEPRPVLSSGMLNSEGGSQEAKRQRINQGVNHIPRADFNSIHAGQVER